MSDPKGTENELEEELHSPQPTDWDDIIFRHRNKRYGAYLLRKRYPKHLIWAFLLSISLLFLVLFFPAIKQFFSNGFEDEEDLTFTEVTLNEPPPKAPVVRPAEPEKPKPVKKKSTAPPKPKADNAVVETEKIEVVEDSLLSNSPTESADTSDVEDTSTPTNTPSEITPIHTDYNTSQDQIPSFPNGEVAMLRFIYDNIRYPTVALEKGIEGTVHISFIIEKNGQVTDIKALDNIGGGCAEEAVRIVRRMPNWNPGKIGGRPIRVQQTLPIKFELKD